MKDRELTSVKRLWLLMKPDSKDIVNIYIYAFFNGLIALSLPLGIQAIINLIQGGQVNTSWIVLIVFVLLGIIFSGVMQIFQLRITENIQQKIFSRAAFEFAYRIPKIKMEELYRKYAPELMNRFFDTVTIQKGLSKLLLDTSSSMLQVVFGLILLSLYHPFFIIFSFTLLLLLYIIFWFTAPVGLKTSLKESYHKYKVAFWLEEIARTANTFKLAGYTNLPLKKLDIHVDNYLDERENHFKVLLTQYSLLIVFKVIVAAGLLVLGGILVMEQHMNIGQFVAAEIIIILIINSVEKLILSLDNIYDLLTSIDKISEVVELEIEENTGEELNKDLLSKSNGLEVDIMNLNFTYPDYGKATINNVSLHINSGERILISGKSGSGKSSLIQLISGLYKIDSGLITFNGSNLNNLKPDDIRSLIGDCLSQEQLFYGTILENITMGRNNATIDNVRWAIKNLFLEDFINLTPNGLETIITSEGKNLPKSVVKKLLLARCIVDKPKLILLEDAFSEIEAIESKSIIEFLTAEENKWTIVAVSQVKELRKHIDKEIILDNGSLISVNNLK
jgi:ABC-type bacteriocin/lantibiotic exporter with double-glycine peptidase domain